MKKIVFTISLLFLTLGLWAQKQVNLNSDIVYRDSNHELISFERFSELTSGNGYILEPVFDHNGDLLEMIVQKESIKSFTPEHIASAPQLVGHPAPEFEGSDLSNHYYNSENFLGKVMVLKFWFSACQPCIQEIPSLNKVVKKYQDNSNVQFLSISLDREDRARKTVQRTGFLYPTVANGKSISSKFSVLGYPTHVIIDRHGNVEQVFQGVNHKIDEKLSSVIEAALTREAYSSRPTAHPIEAEIQLSPASVIVNEGGSRVPFGEFVVLMRENRFELLPMSDGSILMREVARN